MLNDVLQAKQSKRGDLKREKSIFIPQINKEVFYDDYLTQERAGQASHNYLNDMHTRNSKRLYIVFLYFTLFCVFMVNRSLICMFPAGSTCGLLFYSLLI